MAHRGYKIPTNSNNYANNIATAITMSSHFMKNFVAMANDETMPQNKRKKKERMKKSRHRAVVERFSLAIKQIHRQENRFTVSNKPKTTAITR